MSNAMQLPTGTAAPLTVVLTLVTRPDPTPLGERRKAPGNMLDRAGRPINDPAAEPSDNAFEGDPNLNFEKWSAYWRKVHGGRFLYPEDGDASVEKLLRYDQVQRLPAGPTDLDPPPYGFPVDGAGRMLPTVVGHVPPYRRPTWDGAAYLTFADVEDVATVFSSPRVREKILPEERAIFRDLAPLLARQYVILPSASGRDALTLVMTHVRRPGLDREAFQARWLGRHADLVLAQPDTKRFVRRYAQLHNVGKPVEGEPFYHPQTSLIDGVSLLAFSSMNDVEDFLQTTSFRAIREDEREFADLARGEFWTALNITVADRLGPDRVTERSGVD